VKPVKVTLVHDIIQTAVARYSSSDENIPVVHINQNCYHVVFDRKVSWKMNVKIMAWVSLLSHHEKLNKWFTMQCIKEGSTLRVSPKRDKPEPRIVWPLNCLFLEY